MAPPVAKQRALLAVLLIASLAAGLYVLVRQFSGSSGVAEAEHALEERRFDDARLYLKTHLETNPKDARARLLAAQAARRAGKYDEAKLQLRTLETDRISSELLRFEQRLLAIEQGELSGIEEAIATGRDRPNEVETSLLLEAYIVAGLNRIAPSLTTHVPVPVGSAPPLLDKLERLTGMWMLSRTSVQDQVAGLAWRGRMRELAGDHAGALADLRAALERDPSHFEATFHYALFIAQENPSEASSRLESLRGRFPDDPRILFALATALHGLGQLDESARLLDRVIAIEPSSSMAYLQRGEVAIDARKPVEAEAWLRKAFALAPQVAETQLALARCMRLQGRTQEADRFQDRFLELEAEAARPARPVSGKNP